MNAESLSSLAVVDNAMNVIGNISAADVKHLTKTSSLPLLQSSCIHFISVILSERGVENGKDAFPVFYVSPYSTLAHTVAKLVATASHRMWVTEGQSPAQTPSVQPISLSLPSVATAPHAPVPALPALAGSGSPPASPAFPSISAAAYPGARTSGQIAGVVSLTDILNLFAKHSGLVTGDPSEERWARRRSSSVSSKQRPSFDISGARDGALSGSAIADAVPTPVRASGSAISGRERSVDQQKRQ
jgi:CBS domain-containing protein